VVVVVQARILQVIGLVVVVRLAHYELLRRLLLHLVLHLQLQSVVLVVVVATTLVVVVVHHLSLVL
jgi:hypothetical protein